MDKMDKEKIGKSLKARREELRITFADMAQKIGCNRTTIGRWEKGITAIPRSKKNKVAIEYKLSSEEAHTILGLEIKGSLQIPQPHFLFSSITATVEDLEFLTMVAKDLKTPMSLSVIYELLKCRKQQ
jgi:transcriptional regulator with XRE-family HTH domain